MEEISAEHEGFPTAVGYHVAGAATRREERISHVKFGFLTTHVKDDVEGHLMWGEGLVRRDGAADGSVAATKEEVPMPSLKLLNTQIEFQYVTL